MEEVEHSYEDFILTPIRGLNSNKEIVVNNFAVLTLTFTDSSNTPQTDVSVF